MPDSDNKNKLSVTCSTTYSTMVASAQLSNIPYAANASPNITVSTVFNVTVGQDNALTVNTSDPNGDMVTVNLTSHLPEGASFIRGVYTWKPANMEPMNISYAYV